MKFLKKIFGLNGRLDRKGYLLLGVLPMVGWMFLINNFHSSVTDIVGLILFVPIFILALVSTIKRGRDSGLNGLVTLFLFVAVLIGVKVLNGQVKIDISYITLSFIAYLLLIPSSIKELKVIGKVEYALTLTAILLVFPLLIIAPNIISIRNKGKVALVCINMKATTHTLKMFKLDNGVYPTTEEGLNALVSNPNPLKYSNYSSYGYLEKLPKDAWARKLIYVKTKDGFELVSYGADRKEGGEDNGADILYSECQK